MPSMHGTLVADGQSLDGLLYRQGDQVVIFDDGRNESCRDAIYVLNLENGQSILVPLGSVCWIPDFSEQKLGSLVLLTVYGRRFDLQQPGQQGICNARRALQISLDPHRRVTHIVVTEEHLKTRARHLQQPDKEAFFTLQWSLLSAEHTSPASDGMSDSGLSMGLDSPSTSTPASPPSPTEHFGIPMCASPTIKKHHLVFPSSTSCPQVMFSDLDQFTGSISTTEGYQHHMADFAKLESSPYGAFDMNVSPSFLDSSFALDTKAGLLGQNEAFDMQVNYMCLPQAESYPPSSSNSPSRQGLSAPENSMTWNYQSPSAIDGMWQSPYVGQHYESQTRGRVSAASQSRQSEIPRVQAVMPLTALSSQQQQRQPQQHTNTEHGGPSLAHSDMGSGATSTTSLPRGTPLFYRAQAHQTVGLTARVEPYRASVSMTRDRSQSRSPASQPPSVMAHQDKPPVQVTNPFRPELIVDSFRRQTRPHIDVLEARHREQQGSADESATPSPISTALELIRTATSNSLQTLETLRPGSMNSFERTEQRLRQEVDRIIASIQSIRQSALEGSDIPQQDSRQLTQRVESLADFVDYLGNVCADMVAKTNEGQTNEMQPSIQQYNATTQGDLSQSAALFHASLGDNSFHWVEGYTSTSPDQRSIIPSPRPEQQAPFPQMAGNAVDSRSASPHQGLPMVTVFGSQSLASEPTSSTGVASTTLSPSANSISAVPWMHSTYAAPQNVSWRSDNSTSTSQSVYETCTATSAAPTLSQPAMYACTASSMMAGPSFAQNVFLGSTAMVPSISAPGTPANAYLTSSMRPAMPDRRGSLPDRRLMQRERERQAPYPSSHRNFRDRKGSQ